MGFITRKAFAVIGAVVFCVILGTVLFAANSMYMSKDKKPAGVFVASYIPGWHEGSNTQGSIVLVNPTGNEYSNITLIAQIDGVEINNASLRLWDNNFTVNVPHSLIDNMDLFYAMKNYSSPITSISIKPNQNVTVSLNFTASESYRFNSHNLTVYLTKDGFGDLINGQSLTIPPTETYLQVVKLSPVQYDNDTFHLYYDEYRNDNPNFLQQYRNRTITIGSSNYRLAAKINVLGEYYFNVTVHNNSSFPVNSVMLFGQLPDRGGYVGSWGAKLDIGLQPGESYLFPVGERALPINAYATGYITSSTLELANQTTTP